MSKTKTNNNFVPIKKIEGKPSNSKRFTPEMLKKISNECFYENEDYELIKKVFQALGKK